MIKKLATKKLHEILEVSNFAIIFLIKELSIFHFSYSGLRHIYWCEKLVANVKSSRSTSLDLTISITEQRLFCIKYIQLSQG